MLFRLALTLSSLLVANSAFATHWVHCTGLQKTGEVQKATLVWLEGSLGMVGPVEIILETVEFGRIHTKYSISENYEGKRLQKVGYFSDDQEIRLRLMDKEFINDVILFKFNRTSDSYDAGVGIAELSDIKEGYSLKKLTFDKCELL